MTAERNKAKAEGSEPRTAPQSQPASSSSNGQQQRQAEANNAEKDRGHRRTRRNTKQEAKDGMFERKSENPRICDECSGQLIKEEDKSIRALCTHEVVEGIIDSLNEVCTRKVVKELSKAEGTQSGCSVDITNANSSLPMTKMAATLGYQSGFVLDSTTEDANGKKWDFYDLTSQNEAEEKLRKDAPWLLAISLPSTVFATTQSQNFTRQNDKLMERKKVMAHISFAVMLCVMQSQSGRKFMIEQPVGASARGTQLMNKLLLAKGVGKVNFDFCMFDGVDDVPGKWRTPTRRDAGVEDHSMPDVQRRVLQNRVRDRLSLRPSEAKDITGTINELIKVDPNEKELSYDPFEFIDDVTGQTLFKRMEVEAEMQFFRNMKSTTRCPSGWPHAMVARLLRRGGGINKGDQRNPNYTARLVGREIKADSRFDLFGATPPLESLRMICLLDVCKQSGQTRSVQNNVG